MITEECLKNEQEDEIKATSQLLRELLEELKNLRQQIVANNQLRR